MRLTFGRACLSRSRRWNYCGSICRERLCDFGRLVSLRALRGGRNAFFFFDFDFFFISLFEALVVQLEGICAEKRSVLGGVETAPPNSSNSDLSH